MRVGFRWFSWGNRIVSVLHSHFDRGSFPEFIRLRAICLSNAESDRILKGEFSNFLFPMTRKLAK